MVVEFNKKEQFEKDRYLLINNALNPNLSRFLCDYFFLLKANNKTAEEPMKRPGASVIYAADAFETLLGSLVDPLSAIVDIELLPTYSFGRIYVKGNELPPHVDRASCEVSCTVNLGRSDTEIWPIYLRNSAGEVIKCDLDVGDLLIYRGSELPHWREPLPGEWCEQVFLHFVDAKGPLRDHEFDTRPRLGAPASAKRGHHP